MGCLLHCNPGSLTKHKPSVCTLFRTAIKQLCDHKRNIIGSANLAILPFFFWQRKVAKYTYFATACCFIHPPLIFATQNLIISLQHIKLYISLLSQRLWILCIIYYHEKSFINSKSYFAEVVKKNLKGALSGLRQFLAAESHLKIMENALYFLSKALFVLKIFKFLSLLFGHM